MKLWPDKEPTTTAAQLWLLVTTPARVVLMIAWSLVRGLYGPGL